jgi:hypothetical protein
MRVLCNIVFPEAVPCGRLFDDDRSYSCSQPEAWFRRMSRGSDCAGARTDGRRRANAGKRHRLLDVKSSLTGALEYAALTWLQSQR